MPEHFLVAEIEIISNGRRRRRRRDGAGAFHRFCSVSSNSTH